MALISHTLHVLFAPFCSKHPDELQKVRNSTVRQHKRAQLRRNDHTPFTCFRLHEKPKKCHRCPKRCCPGCFRTSRSPRIVANGGLIVAFGRQVGREGRTGRRRSLPERGGGTLGRRARCHRLLREGLRQGQGPPQGRPHRGANAIENSKSRIFVPAGNSNLKID